MKAIGAIDVLVNVMINDDKAPNYKGWIVEDENTGNNYVITVQLKDGETPSQQLAAANEEIEELSLRNELMVKLGSKANSELRQGVELLTNQLAAAKAEIAEYRELLEQIVDMNAMPPYQLGIIERLLAKHKAE